MTCYYRIRYCLMAAIGSLMIGCTHPYQTPDGPMGPVTPQDSSRVEPSGFVSSSSRQDLFRPQVHYTPLRNWMNDPNGLYYQDGLWHLCYQYNYSGEGCDFDHMCWGHASSPDLMHWTEHTPVLHWDENGAIYSGCTVVDERNVSGLGQNAVISFYTMHSWCERIAMAVRRGNSPMYDKLGEVVHSDLADFRDPNVVWDEQHQRWVMTIARGGAHGIEIWTSTNLRGWDFQGIFSTPIARCNMGDWECPALIPFDDKWVLFISTNHNAAVFGSGTMYFVGSFDGKMFVPDATEYPRFVDYGVDCYAGVPFSHAPEGRKVIIAWMNNWDYATVLPYSGGYRSAMTMPREIGLTTVDGTDYLTAQLPNEITTLVDSVHVVDSLWCGGDRCDAWLVEATVPVDESSELVLSNRRDERYVVRVDALNRRIVCDRSGRCGLSWFSNIFSVSDVSAPIRTEGNSITLQILVDHSSVEVFSADGAISITNLVFPTEPYSTLRVEGQTDSTIVKTLHTIW